MRTIQLISILGFISCSSSSGQQADSKSIASRSEAPRRDELVITEVMANPAVCSDSTGEWFEIYNRSSRTVPLEGLLVGRTSDPYTVAMVTGATPLAPGDYAVLARGSAEDWCTDAGFQPSGFYSSGPSIRNSVEQLFISYPLMGLLDMTPELSAKSGVSIQFADGRPSATDNDDADKWALSECQIRDGVDLATPGQGADDCTESEGPILGTTGDAKISMDSDYELFDFGDVGTGLCEMGTGGSLTVSGDFGPDEHDGVHAFEANIQIASGGLQLEDLYFEPDVTDDGCIFQPAEAVPVGGEISDDKIEGAIKIGSNSLSCSWVEGSPADDLEYEEVFIDVEFTCKGMSN